MADGNEKFKDLFIEEANDQLRSLSTQLLEIEKEPENIERYSALMRAAHTVKGAAATMGYTNMAKLAHALEDVFHLGERNAITMGSDAVSAAFVAVDRMRASLESIKEQGRELDVDAAVSVLENAAKENASSQVPRQEAARGSSVPDIVSALPSNVRVDVERLDALMGLFEEMLMVRLKLDSLLEPATGIVKTVPDHALKERLYFLKEFESLFAQLARLLSETQEQLLVIRLVPIELIFSQFPRMVRDLSLREGKTVRLSLEGGGVELDRTVLGGLGGALAHLTRNAIDHGIEREGTVILSAKHVGDRVHVSVEDDGAGIDYERVKEVAVERGIVGKEKAGTLRRQEVAELLFHPNMSTNREVTDISGRGVGLSAVQSFAQEVGGHVSVVSPLASGKGTRFVLDLPVSLATVKVLLVESSRYTFALPFAMVVRTLSFKRADISRSAHQEMVLVDGAFVPLLYLNKLLDISFTDLLFGTKKEEEEIFAILLSIEGDRSLIAIDRCLGEEDLLIKSLPPVLRSIRGFSGSALLPDGRTILLLDAYGLLSEALGDILGVERT